MQLSSILNRYVYFLLDSVVGRNRADICCLFFFIDEREKAHQSDEKYNNNYSCEASSRHRHSLQLGCWFVISECLDK